MFIDWSLWSVVGPIVVSRLWFEYGLSWNQIRTNDVHNVVLLVVDPSSIHPYIFGLTNAITCSLNYGIPFKRKPGWIVVEPIDNILISSMILLNIKLVLENFWKHFFMLVHEAYVWTKEVTFPNSRAFDVSCRREFRKACFCLLRNHPKLVMHVRSALWFGRLAASILYVFPSTPSH